LSNLAIKSVISNSYVFKNKQKLHEEQAFSHKPMVPGKHIFN